MPAAPDAQAQGVWARVVRAGGSASALLRVFLINTRLVSLSEGRAVLACDGRFSAGADRHAEVIAGLFRQELGRAVAVEFIPSPRSEAGTPLPGPAPDQRSVPDTQPTQAPAPESEAPSAQFNPERAVQDPLVRRAIELFGARVVEVQPRKPA